MNILLVTYEFPPEMATGGIGSYMNHLAYLLHQNGHRVTVFSATVQRSEIIKTDQSYCINYLIPSIDLIDFRNRSFLLFESLKNELQIDIIESPEVGACALEIKKANPGLPLIVKLHTPGVIISNVYQTYTPFIQKIRYVVGALLKGRIDLGFWAKNDRNKESDPEYQICLLANCILSPSQALKKRICRFWSLPEEKIRVIANPFTASPDLYEVKIERHTKAICFVGKLTVLKGMYTFTKAMKKVMLHFPDYELLIAGRDELIPQTNKSMKEWMESEFKGFRDRVKFLGAITGDEVKKVLSQCEICVVPSLWENYPTVILEAMAAGCTVVASNRGGIPELVENNKTGLLFNALSTHQLLLKVISLLKNPDRRFALALSARKSLQKLSNKNEELIRIYQVSNFGS